MDMKSFARYIITALLMAATLLLLVFPHLSPTTAGNLALIPFCAIPLFLITLLVTFLFWKDRAARYLSLTTLLLSLFYLHPYIPRPSALFSSLDKQNSPATLTIVSWNCDNFQLREDTLIAVAKAINELHPDIICLQERPHTSLLDINKIKKAFSQYPYVATNTREDEVLNVAVFSRFPLSHAQPHYFPDSFNKYLSVDVHLSDRVSSTVPVFRLFDVHLQTTGLSDRKHDNSAGVRQMMSQVFIANSIKRNHQSDEIARDIKASPYPTIVCGDFNSTCTSYPYRKFAYLLQDTYHGICGSFTYHIASLSPRIARYIPFKSVPVKIDHIMVSSPFSPCYYEQAPYRSGDHRIQCAVIRMPK